MFLSKQKVIQIQMTDVQQQVKMIQTPLCSLLSRTNDFPLNSGLVLLHVVSIPGNLPLCNTWEFQLCV